MGDELEMGAPAVHVRVSDEERQSIIDLLREQTSVGRLTLAEFEERLDEVYRARTAEDLRLVLRELPVEPDPGTTAAAPDASTSELELRRRYRQRIRNDLAGFAVPNFVCNFIWFMGGADYWWPGWVLMGTGVGIVGTLVKGFDPDKERLALEAERRAQAISQIVDRRLGSAER